MKGTMGHFGEAQAPTIVMESKNNKSGIISLLKPVGYLFLGGIGILGVISILDYLERRTYHYPDGLDAIENFKTRIKDLSKKLDDGTISDKEADELYQIVHTSKGRFAGYTSKQYPGQIRDKLEEHFKAQRS
jgi:hypothetical protein